MTTPVGSSVPCGCCPVPSDARCYRTAAGQPQRAAFPLRCGDELLWVDSSTGLTVDTSLFEPCVDESFTVTTLTMSGAFFGDGPDSQGENICNIVPAPSSTVGWGASVSGPQCLDPTSGFPTITWTSVSSVELEYGNPPRTSGGVQIGFSSPDIAPSGISWPASPLLNPGQYVTSNAGISGRRARLTYLSGPLANHPSWSIYATAGTNFWLHQNATNNSTPPIRFRLDLLAP